MTGKRQGNVLKYNLIAPRKAPPFRYFYRVQWTEDGGATAHVNCFTPQSAVTAMAFLFRTPKESNDKKTEGLPGFTVGIIIKSALGLSILCCSMR